MLWTQLFLDPNYQKTTAKSKNGRDWNDIKDSSTFLCMWSGYVPVGFLTIRLCDGCEAWSFRFSWMIHCFTVMWLCMPSLANSLNSPTDAWTQHCSCPPILFWLNHHLFLSPWSRSIFKWGFFFGGGGLVVSVWTLGDGLVFDFRYVFYSNSK